MVRLLALPDGREDRALGFLLSEGLNLPARTRLPVPAALTRSAASGDGQPRRHPTPHMAARGKAGHAVSVAYNGKEATEATPHFPENFQRILGRTWTAAAYLEKPIKPEKLVAEVKKVLR